MKIITLCLFLWHLALLSGGQSFTTINYSVPEGFPSSEVYEVYQDRKGFLWFATDNGVVRFDGHEMQTFSIEEGLSDPVVFAFHEDYRGRIWFRTYSGRLSYYENQKIHHYQFNDSLARLSSSVISSIHMDSLDQLWFSTFGDRGVWGKIDAKGNIQKEFIDGYEIYYKEVEKVRLIGHRQRPIQKISINNKIISFHPDFVCPSRQIIPIRWKSKLYISMCENLFVFDGNNLKKVLKAQSSIISLSKDRNDHLWIGCINHGVERYSTPDFKEKWSPNFLKDLSVSKVLQDHENGIWFSTLEQGVFYIPNFSIRNHSLDPSLKIKLVSSDGNQVFVGTNMGNVITFNKKGEEQFSKSFYPPLSALFVDKNKNLLVSDDKNTYYSDSEFKIKKTYPSISIANVDQDPHGVIWAISGRSLVTINTSTYELSINFKPFIYRKILADDNFLFLATRDGLHICNHSLSLIHNVKELINHKISGIFKLNTSTYLITTIGNGYVLFKIKNQGHYQLGTKSKLIAHNIYSAVKVDTVLWMGTEKGIIKINIPSLLKDNPKVELISKQNGLINNQINHLLYMAPNIWAFSDKGFSLIDIDKPSFSNAQPDFYLKGITVDKEQLDPEKSTNLPYDKNNIQIDFGFISFNNQNILTRYRLNKENPWIYSTNRRLQFYALSPSQYFFELQFSTDNSMWKSAYKSPGILIRPPLWQTWYFQSIIALLVLALILLYFVNQVRIYKKHQRKLIQAELEAIEEERSRIAKDLHDSVGTDFTAIKMIVSQLLSKHSEPKTGEVETQFQSTIQDIKNIIYGLSPPGLERYGLFSGLKNYVDKLNGTIPIKIDIKTFGIEIKDPKLSMTVFRIIQELISNSLKHSNAKTITLHLNSFEDLLNIVYEDNGKGFSFEENHKGLGLYNIESRIQSVNGRIKFESGSFGISYAIDIPIQTKDS